MEQTHIFDQIKNGMPVLQESDKEKIGTVEFVRYGEGVNTVDLPNIETVVEALTEAFTTERRYPDEVYEKLYAEGFLRVERGLEPDVYVFPNQIAHVLDGEVHVNTHESNLMKE